MGVSSVNLVLGLIHVYIIQQIQSREYAADAVESDSRFSFQQRAKFRSIDAAGV